MQVVNYCTGSSGSEADKSLKDGLPAGILNDLKQQLEKNLYKINDRYASYVRCIKLCLLSKEINAKDLRTYLLSLTAFKYNQDVKLLSSIRSQLEKAGDLEDSNQAKASS